MIKLIYGMTSRMAGGSIRNDLGTRRFLNPIFSNVLGCFSSGRFLTIRRCARISSDAALPKASPARSSPAQISSPVLISPGRAGGQQGLALVGVHEPRGFQQPWLVAGRDGQEAVLVGVDQLSRLNLPPKDFDLDPPADRTGIGMADAHAPGQRLEAGRGHLVQVPDASVDYRSHAAQGTMDVARDLAPESADQARLVQILHHHNLRAGHRGEVPAVLAPGVGIGLAMLGVARLGHHGDGISHHRPHLGHIIVRGLES